MDALTRVVPRHAYNSYTNRDELIEPVFQLFLTADDGTYLMRDVAKTTNVPLTTLYSWRERIRVDPDWRPSSSRSAQNARELPDEVEEIIASFLRINFISEGRPLTRTTLQPLVLMLVQDLVVQNVLDERHLAFKCSSHFLSRFLKRVGLSFRRARPERRPPIDDAECALFLSKLNGAFLRYPPDAILNFDESSWHLVMSGEQMVAERGVEAVHQYVNGDAKASFTFFATISAAGQKFPLILLAKGKTPRCHKQLGVHPEYAHEIWHSPTGWSTETLMIAYLHWLRQLIPVDPLCLVLDQFRTHTTDDFETEAQQLEIETIRIPKGATGRYQPLDRRTFGALKSKGRAKWRKTFLDHYGIECTREMAAALLLESWEELSESAISAGWDYDEDLGDEDDADDSDDEFQLLMSTESDGEIEAVEEDATDDEF
jgi:transposase